MVRFLHYISHSQNCDRKGSVVLFSFIQGVFMHLSKTLSVTCAALLLAAGVAQAKPQVYVTGTVKYDPAKTFNSYVIMATKGTTR